MIRKLINSFALILVSLATIPSPIYAGWIQTDADGSKTFISEGKIKYVEDESIGNWIIMDYKNNRVTMTDADRNVYATGTIDSYCHVLNSLLEAFDEMSAAFGDEEEDEIGDVEIVAAGTDTVAGMSADKYKIILDGELYEEIWLTTAPEVIAELGKSSHHEKMMDCLQDSDDPVENSPEYRRLALKGWELRNIVYDFGEKEYEIDVVEFKKASIPDSEFKVPSSFKKLSFEELFEQGM